MVKVDDKTLMKELEELGNTTALIKYERPDPDDHFWGTVRADKQIKKQKKVFRSYKLLRKYGMNIIPTNTPNIVETDYWGDYVKISLTSWAFKFPDKKKWIKPKKKIWGLRSIMDRGKHKGMRLKELIEKDPQYMRWVLDNWKDLFSKEVHDKVKKYEIKP